MVGWFSYVGGEGERKGNSSDMEFNLESETILNLEIRQDMKPDSVLGPGFEGGVGQGEFGH